MSVTVNPPNPDFLALKPESTPPELRESSRPVQLNDGGIRLLCIPLFGIVIPLATGLPRPASAGLLLPFFWFVAVSAAIWHGNRYFYLRQRQRHNWFQHPALRIANMLAAIVFYTVPCSAGMLWLWFAMIDTPPDWPAIRSATLLSVICVVFITHVYETVYLIQQRESDLLHFEKLERAKAQAELEALKNQLDPHFMFNSLNALSWLIENDPARAVAFNDNLADVYRYILSNKDRLLVSLNEELAFVRQYCALLQLRFEDAVQPELPAPRAAFDSLFLPPISLQTLVENAVKHTEFSRENPLRIRIEAGADFVTVENDARTRLHARPTPGVGLRNLGERCRLLLARDLEVERTLDRFSVRLPLKLLD